MIRWECPNCGSGTNAPERPRKNDVRRYCLTCSASTGVLVERQAPKLERRRATAALRTKDKLAAKRQRERDAKFTSLSNARGEEVRIDLVAEVRRALREMGKPQHAQTVQVDVRRRSDCFCSGRAYPWEQRVVLSVGRGVGLYEEAVEMAYHEAAHIAAGRDARDPRGRNWHGEQFHRTLANALQARWPFVRYGSLRSHDGYGHDWHVQAQFKDHTKIGGEL